MKNKTIKRFANFLYAAGLIYVLHMAVFGVFLRIGVMEEKIANTEKLLVEQVVLLTDNGKSQYQVTTNNQGKFEKQNIPSGLVDLNFTEENSELLRHEMEFQNKWAERLANVNLMYWLATSYRYELNIQKDVFKGDG